MATYRLRLSQTREFKVRSIDHLLQEIASVFCALVWVRHHYSKT